MHAARVPNLIQLVGHGVIQGQPLLVTAPWGRTLTIDDSAAVILSAVSAAAETLQAMGNLPEPTCHGDISLGNLIVVCSHQQNISDCKTYVLDWVTMRKEQQGEMAECKEATGTLTFMAISVLEGFANTISADLESLALILIFLAGRAQCDWAFVQHVKISSNVKQVSLMQPKQWRRWADSRIQSDTLRHAADRLRDLFWGSSHSTAYLDNYNDAVRPSQFLQALQEPPPQPQHPQLSTGS